MPGSDVRGKEQDKEESREMRAAATQERGETEGDLMEREESNPTEHNRYGLTESTGEGVARGGGKT